MFFHLSLPLSSLVCLHPSLPCGLPISTCFSPIFLLNCFVASHISSGRSSFFCQPSLFVLFDKTRTNFQLLLLFCRRHCLQIQIKACLCNTSSQDFPSQLFQNVSVQHDSFYLSASLRSLLYPVSHVYLWMLIIINHSSKLHKAIHLVELLIIQPYVQVLSLMSNPHLFCLLPAHYRSVLLEHPLP